MSLPPEMWALVGNFLNLSDLWPLRETNHFHYDQVWDILRRRFQKRVLEMRSLEQAQFWLSQGLDNLSFTTPPLSTYPAVKYLTIAGPGKLNEASLPAPHIELIDLQVHHLEGSYETVILQNCNLFSLEIAGTGRVSITCRGCLSRDPLAIRNFQSVSFCAEYCSIASCHFWHCQEVLVTRARRGLLTFGGVEKISVCEEEWYLRESLHCGSLHCRFFSPLQNLQVHTLRCPLIKRWDSLDKDTLREIETDLTSLALAKEPFPAVEKITLLSGQADNHPLFPQAQFYQLAAK